MSQRASDWESIRQGPGKRTCKRSLGSDQTSGSSSSNQNSGALSDWLPGATVQTLAEAYVSYIIAVLSCLSLRGSSQGIDEPADLECRGVPAFVASCWAQESPKLSITRSDLWFGKCFTVPYIGNNHPYWLIFFRGGETTNVILLTTFDMDRLQHWYDLKK